MVAATFRHETSRNLDPRLHTHTVIANMVRGEDGRWRTMANERLYASEIGAMYRNELAREVGVLGRRIGKTHADGCFKIAGIPRKVAEAFSTRRAEIKAATAKHGLGDPSENQSLALRAALMTCAHKRDVDKEALRESWKILYVEISRARDRAELVTDDWNALRERLEVATGERIAALEAVEPQREKSRGPEPVHGSGREDGTPEPRGRTPERAGLSMISGYDVGA